MFEEGKHVYSYTQLSSVDECPYGFYLQRIEKVPTVENAFSQQGSLIHDLIDLWGKGMLTKDELVGEYERRYPNEVTNTWPRVLASKGYATKAFELGKEYFENFDEFNGYEIISTEEKFKTDIEGRPFVGIIDMVLKEKDTGALIILDHKSKSMSAFKKDADKMFRQQYCYSKYFIEKYGRAPDKLMFNLFKEKGELISRDWDQTFYEDTMFWAIETIKKIETYQILDWLTSKQQDFFCTELCSVRKECSNGTQIEKKSKKKK